MTAYVTYDDIGVTLDNLVATIEIQRPPHNFFDIALIKQIADVLEKLDADDDCRASVLCAEGKAFCAGANFGDGEALDEKGQFKSQSEEDRVRHLYMEAVRLFECRKPIVGAIEGPAIGGGLGLAMVPDFRVTCSEARFAANFTRLGFHPGFGLTETLPAIVGQQNANLMFFTSRRFKGDEAYAMGLADVLVAKEEVRATAHILAAEIAENSPLGVGETRATVRQGLADRVRTATARELEIQKRLKATADFKEGVKAMAERRVPNFIGA